MIESLRIAASSFAPDVDFLILLVTIIGGFGLIVAEAILFYFIFKYSAKKNPRGQYISGDEKHQKKWITIPHKVVLLADVVFIFFAVKVWYHVKQELPQADETIRIIGQQWSWRFVHPGPDKVLGTDDDIETVEELHVKVGKTYHYKLETMDVIHDFSVPVFRLKQDAIPGRVMTGWFKPTREGVFDIQCAKMCGIGHGIMNARIYVQSEEEYNKWQDNKKAIAGVN